MENLAPAGNPEALERAIAAGADAVYLGYTAYSARAGAGNFDAEQLQAAVQLAHLHHVRVHVTVNTLMKEEELPGVMEVLHLLNRLCVDAVLVQDLGVLALARRCFPDLPLHASTQMAIHNAAGVRWCGRMGLRRVVLARECSVAEIALAAREGPEVEVFGHGAQCVGVSGQCLFSSMVGGRSGNRGRCAQPCRLPYTYRGKTAAWLSPRDVCLRDDLPALAKAGVASLKIEGRLKRPEYVEIVAESYRHALDALADGRFRPADEAEKDGLKQIFQRGGFMRGYAMGVQDAGVISPDRVNHGGLPIGTVEAVLSGLARVRLTRELHDGDGLQIRAHGAEADQELIYAGHDTPAGAVAVLRLRPGMRVRPGDAVFRLTDARQLAQARAKALPPIPCDLTLTALPGQPLTLVASDGEASVTCQGEAVACAQKCPLTREDAVRSLSKMGDTPFSARELRVETADAFVPVSALNELRRQALADLAQARAAAFARPVGREMPLPEVALPERPLPPTVILRNSAQRQALTPWLIEVGEPVRLVWYPEDFRHDALEAALADWPEGVWLHLPMACEQATLEQIRQFVVTHQDRLGGVVLGSVGQLGMDWPVPVGAGEGVPMMNRRAADLLLHAGCEFVTASCELSGPELASLMQGRPPILVPAYGREQLMLLHHCPARTYLGLEKGHADCRMCDVHHPDALENTSLMDRKRVSFPLLRLRLPEGCLVRLMNSLPTNVLARVRKAGYAPLISLTNEAGEELSRSVAALRGLETGERTTSGHWKNPVE